MNGRKQYKHEHYGDLVSCAFSSKETIMLKAAKIYSVGLFLR